VTFTRIDHVMIAVPELDRGVDTYARLGFSVQPGGEHPGIGTHNAIAFNEEDYLELIAIRDRDQYARRNPWSGLAELVERGGACYLIVQATISPPTSPRCADAAWIRRRRGGRTVGRERRKFALLGPRNPCRCSSFSTSRRRRAASAARAIPVYRTERLTRSAICRRRDTYRALAWRTADRARR
jgi:hypothetical protein